MDGLGYDGWSRGFAASLDMDEDGGADSSSAASFSFAQSRSRAGAGASSSVPGAAKANAYSSNSSKNARGASGGSFRGGKSEYDYDISLDDVDDFEASLSPGDIRNQVPKRSASQEPRLSQAERTQQLIQRASSERRATLSRERAARDDDAAAFSSFQDSWNELMQGLESHPASASLSRSRSISPNPVSGADESPVRAAPGASYAHSAAAAAAAGGRVLGGLRSPNDSDSFEISAGDFEVQRILAIIVLFLVY
jgi:hypothetical protein